MIEASEKMTSPHNNPTVNKDLELQIKMLQNASRDADNLKALLKAKERENMRRNAHRRDTKRLVTEEIEMLKVVLYLVCRNTRAHMQRDKQANPKA
jgi:hypothetical protein